MSVRLKDIARDLGVSVITVSKALRDHPDISVSTKQRVREQANKRHYRPNMVARSLVTGRTYTVGLVIPDLMHSFFPEIAAGIAKRLSPRDYQVIICNTNEDAELEKRQIDRLLARRVDGLIIASVQRQGYQAFFRALEGQKVPCVLIDEALSGVRASFVGVNDEELGALATEHLLASVCQRIAHIRGPALATATGRLRGYRRALARHGFEPPQEYVVSGEHAEEPGRRAMLELLKIKPHPDGVFCYNDPVAVGALRAVWEAGLKVPSDIAIVGAANVHYSDLLRTPLSTVDQNSMLMGEKAAELLLDSIDAKGPTSTKRILLPVRLVVRDSSLRLPSRDTAEAFQT